MLTADAITPFKQKFSKWPLTKLIGCSANVLCFYFIDTSWKVRAILVLFNSKVNIESRKAIVLVPWNSSKLKGRSMVFNVRRIMWTEVKAKWRKQFWNRAPICSEKRVALLYFAYYPNGSILKFCFLWKSGNYCQGNIEFYFD